MDYQKKICDTIQKLGIQINNEQAEKFLLYINLLLEWNKKFNLTAITDKNEIITKHFADSLSILSFTQIKNLNVIDIGSGAGLPGVPLKILHPDINLTLLDSLAKRVKFLETLKNELALQNISCIHARAEEFAKLNDQRENYDLCVSRAVSNLAVLSELCLPFVKVGGTFISYKGFNIAQEIENAKSCINKLGAKIFEIKKISLPDFDIAHSLIFIRKLSHTPIKYPRVYAKILKSPL